MKYFVSLLLCTIALTMNAQVGINTITPDDGSLLQIDGTTGAFVPPRLTTIEMNNIPTPLDGAVVYNTTSNALFIRTSGVWTGITSNNNNYNATIIVNRSYLAPNTVINGTDNTFFDFPIGVTEILTTDPATYTVTANGTVTINITGNYLLNASFSMTNAPSGNRKYIIAATVDGAIIGYIARGFATIPSSFGGEYWGTSGSIMYPLASGQVVKFRYVFNNEGNSLSARYFNFGITKLN